jgi:peptide-methionine (S)-S-oxide reductase
VFFGSHDPTTLNRQGPDAGRQYRSAIFYQNDYEKSIAEAYIKELEESNVFKSAITTEVVALKAFYPAEDYHQDYEKKNPGNPYVKAVSVPRLKKFQSKYPELLKKGAH